MGNAMKGIPQGDKKAMERHDPGLKSSDEDTLIVLSDYPSPDVTEPIFRMGAKLRLVSQQGIWWRVFDVHSVRENYIPKSYVAKVYHGWLFEGVTRQNAEALLRLPGNRPGSFMIRESPKEKGVYSLSVSSRTIKHYRILRLANSWYYISPSLTFQCLEDMVNHYSDSADGLCCVLTTPCLSFSTNPSNTPPHPGPVVMRRNFDWKDVDRSELINSDNQDRQDGRDTMVSYGVRNSVASYLSLVGTQAPKQRKRRQQKSKSVYMFPEHGMALEEEPE